jgi:hypothetical protein
MRKHVVFVALSSSLMAAAGPAPAQGSRQPTSAPAAGLAGVLETPSAWVLRVPLTLTLAPPARHPAVTFPSPATSRSLDDLGRYPDPRRAALRRFHLELRLEQDFSFASAPLSSRAVRYQPEVAWQALDAGLQPTWQSDLVLRLPRDLYAGAAAEQRAVPQRSLFVVAGQRF